VPEPSPIPTPLFVKWQRAQHRIVPFLAVALCAAVAWRLWQDSPRMTAVGQVDSVTAEARAPAAGMLVDPGTDPPALYETVSAGQVIARVEQAGGKTKDVAAPIAGQVIKIHRRPGQQITAGEVVATIAADRGTTITTYLRAEQRARAEPGMIVDARERADSSAPFHATIERIGPQYEPVPSSQLRDRKTEEWGLPVVLSIPPEVNLKPGELVYLGWHTAPAAPEK
jgi:multidrug efflux pump subunit AcrA (membrane-fusion protein)